MKGPCANGVKCGVVEWVKRNTLRWFGHTERKNNEEFVKKVYVKEIADLRRRERPVVRWKNRMKENMHERVAEKGRWIKLIRRECLDRERWRLF